MANRKKDRRSFEHALFMLHLAFHYFHCFLKLFLVIARENILEQVGVTCIFNAMPFRKVFLWIFCVDLGPKLKLSNVYKREDLYAHFSVIENIFISRPA